MSLINRIAQMKKEGLNNEQITRGLSDEGASPKEIDEALDQSQVKSAIGTYEDLSMPQDFPITHQLEESEPAVEYPSFRPEEMGNQENILETQGSASQEPQEIQPPSQQEYQQYPQYQYQQEASIDTDMISELCSQIVDERTKKLESAVTELTKSTIEQQGKLENFETRIRRIEQIIDKLQASIIGQIGLYGKNISDLKKEMQLTQESFSKIISPLNDSMQELRKIAADIKKN